MKSNNTTSSLVRTALWGLLAAFVSQGLMGVLFLNPWTQGLLYHEQWQSLLYRQVTPQRDLLPSIVGLVVWGLIPAFLHRRLAPSGSPWRAGLATATWIWLLFWLPQEWFIYVTLLGEPLPLAGLELVLAALGSLAQGLLLAIGLKPGRAP